MKVLEAVLAQFSLQVKPLQFTHQSFVGVDDAFIYLLFQHSHSQVEGGIVRIMFFIFTVPLIPSNPFCRVESWSGCQHFYCLLDRCLSGWWVACVLWWSVILGHYSAITIPIYLVHLRFPV